MKDYVKIKTLAKQRQYTVMIAKCSNTAELQNLSFKTAGNWDRKREL
jgi:hypothetical protein